VDGVCPSCELPRSPKASNYGGERHGEAPQSSSAELIIRQKEPTNLETPSIRLTLFNSEELFYIRSHFPAPRTRARLVPTCIDGGQESVFSELPAVARHAIRDAGRHSGVAGKVGFSLSRGCGSTWELVRRNAEWTGVPLELCSSGPAWKSASNRLEGLSGDADRTADRPRSRMPGVPRTKRSPGKC